MLWHRMAAETLEYHYGKHHQTYVTNLNNLIKGTAFEGKSLEEIVRASEGGIFNNAAFRYGEPHTLLLELHGAKRWRRTDRKLADAIAASFGSFARNLNAVHRCRYQKLWFRMDAAGKALMANWLSFLPQMPFCMTTDATPLLTVDVWKRVLHRYRNARPNYLGISGRWLTEICCEKSRRISLSTQKVRLLRF